MQTNNFLVLGEGSTDINGSVSLAEKKFSINFSKAKETICLTFHYNDSNSYLFFKERESYKF